MAEETTTIIQPIQQIQDSDGTAHYIAAKYSSNDDKNEEINKTYLRLDGGVMTGTLNLGDEDNDDVRLAITSKNPYIHFVNLDEPLDKRTDWYVQAHYTADQGKAFYIGSTWTKAAKIDADGNLTIRGKITARDGLDGTAAKATGDADGNTISTTYLKKANILTEHALSLTDKDVNESSKPFITDIDTSSHTITVTRGGLSDLGLSTVYDYKGSKTWTQLLDLTSAKAGDVYHISSGAPDGKNGSNWACYTAFDSKISSANYKNYWQPLGGIVDLSGYAYKEASNIFDGEQKMKNSSYCPTMFDIAGGIGCSLKNTRALDNQAIIGELLLPYTSQNLGGAVETEQEEDGNTLQNDPNICQVTSGKLTLYKIDSVGYGKITGKTPIGTFSSKGWEGNVTGSVTGNVTGNSDTATEVLDYGDTTRKIKIGFATAALDVDEISHIAGYTDNGTKIKDVGQKTLQDWLSCFTFTKYDDVTVAGNTKDVYKVTQGCLFVPEGFIMGGSAAAAGLVTRGICGITTPTAGGAATKDNLYLNFEGNDENGRPIITWNPNGRGVVINAGSPGVDLGEGMYSYCAVRGDIVKAFCDANYVIHNSNRVNLISSNNEFNFIPDEYGGEDGYPIYINYNTYGDQKNGKITAYHFNTGNGKTDNYADIYVKTLYGNVRGDVAGDLSGNATTATKLETARTIQTDLSSTTSASFDGSDSVTPGVTGTLSLSNGGTGQTTAINAANSFLNALSTGDADPKDNDYFISQYADGGTTHTTYHRRPVSKLWNYMKGKVEAASFDTISSRSFTGELAGNATTSSYPYGFTSRVSGAPGWGTLTEGNGYTYVTGWQYNESADDGIKSSDIVFAAKKGTSSSESTGEISIQIDGFFYQNEGRYQVLDTNNFSKHALPRDGGTLTGALKVSGRLNGAGDDEGIVIGKANNGYAGLCLGDPIGLRSVFYLTSNNVPCWRYSSGVTGEASYDIEHPKKSGTIALTSDISAAVNALINGAPGTLDTLKEIADFLTDNTVANGLIQLLGDKVSKSETSGQTIKSDIAVEKNLLIGGTLTIANKAYYQYNSTDDCMELIFK